MKNVDADLINKSRQEAEAILNEEGTRFRYDMIDGIEQELDCSLDIERINLSLSNDKVVITHRG